MRADGVAVSATNVSASCHPNPASYAIWATRLKSGLPSGWKNSAEKPQEWTDEERERVIEALSYLPPILLDPAVAGVYRLSRSAAYDQNPGAGAGKDIVLYGPAFDSDRNLARVIAHEFAHKIYSHFSDDDLKSYNTVAEWIVRDTPRGDQVHVPIRESYVEDDGKEDPDEDFSNNIEYYLFQPGELKSKAPKVFEWIRKRYGVSFRIGRRARK